VSDETNQLRVRLVTPERVLFDASATAVELPSKSGYMEVLFGHAPLLAELGAGDVVIHGGQPDSGSATGSTSSATGSASGDSRYNVSWGFVEVLPDRVTILASDALKPGEIDVARAKEQLERGNKEWREAGDSEEAYSEALHVIAEAEAKLATASEKH
jgi:F-type H+-transporting ATPase subunit epsilon